MTAVQQQERPHRSLPERSRLHFQLPEDLAAREPPEVLPGATRADVRLMVSDGQRPPTHHDFSDLPDLLGPDDLLVVNTSSAIPAAIDGCDGDDDVRLHLSTEMPAGLWLVEVRRPTADGSSRPDGTDRTGHVMTLRGGATVRLLTRFDGSERLWIATVDPRPSAGVLDHFAEFARPIRYAYVERDWPIAAYQTAFGKVPGSAEMPSASRPFTPELITELVTNGVTIAPLILHTGVSSLEAREVPYPERFSVPPATARKVNEARREGGRVVAIGTTVVRALESVVDNHGVVHPGEGWTDVIVRPGPIGGDAAPSVDGLLTGWHEPDASHLLMLEAIASPGALDQAYRAAITSRYRWHEFGDVHLILR